MPRPRDSLNTSPEARRPAAKKRRAHMSGSDGNAGRLDARPGLPDEKGRTLGSGFTTLRVAEAAGPSAVVMHFGLSTRELAGDGTRAGCEPSLVS